MMPNVAKIGDTGAFIGKALDERILSAIIKLPAHTTRDLPARIQESARRNKLIYWREGKGELVNVLLRPLAMVEEQRNYIHTVSCTILEALKRVPDMYLNDAAVRAIVPLSEPEDAWLQELWTSAHSTNHTVWGRLDAMIDFTSSSWVDSLAFVEANLVGVGGILFIPGVTQVALETVVPLLTQVAPELELRGSIDCRTLFMREIEKHQIAIGRRGGTLAFMDAKYSGDGPDEFAGLADFYKEQGVSTMYVDPAELELCEIGGTTEVCFEQRPIDVLYRDYELGDLIESVAECGKTEAFKLLFRRNQIVSSMAGDFDHKSVFELLTDDRFNNYFTPGERLTCRGHVLWTRLFHERKTTTPDGAIVDLVTFTRMNRESLVLKPNRSYGGDRVLIGHALTDREWYDGIGRALTKDGDWVVQRAAHASSYVFPTAQPDNTLSMEPYYVVMGFAPSQYGTAVFGRASQSRVVNVAQRGGLCAVLVGNLAAAA